MVSNPSSERRERPKLSEEAYVAKARLRLHRLSVIDTETGCWRYQGSRNPKGYGYFGWRVKSLFAHRAAWMAFRGPIPAGMEVCHTCDVRNCVNPDHLWIGTHKQNVRDCVDKGRQGYAKRTHCPRGHAYSAENTAMVTNWHGGQSRQCKECTRARHRARYHKLKAERERHGT